MGLINNLEEFVSLERFYHQMAARSSCRHFSDRDVDPEVLKTCVKIAGTAPSGANTQPWQFCIVTDKLLKKEIRTAAEIEESNFYHHRAPEEFLRALKPFQTNEKKEHLEKAPALIAIFSQLHNSTPQGLRKCYYPMESVGIATGMLITALHLSGLSCLTHTPNPMRFLNSILLRPGSERPFLILAVGYPDPAFQPPRLHKKSFGEICQIYEGPGSEETSLA